MVLPRYKFLFFALCVAAFTTVFPALSHGNDFLADGEKVREGTYGFVGAGVGVTNEFEGSDDFQTIPFAAGRVHFEHRYIEMLGLGARANIVNHDNIQFGPAFRFRFGRDDDVENDTIARLDPLDDAFEAGAFARYDFSPGLKQGDSLGFETQFVQDISDAHEGYQISLGMNYNTPVTEKLFLGGDIGTSYASDDYMENFFSVSGAESVRTGLRQFDAGAGFKDVSVGFNAQYAFNRKWGIFGRASYQRLFGDAADSSIVEQEGNANQFLFGTGISYRF